MEGLFEGGLCDGGLKIFLVIGHIPVEVFLPIRYFLILQMQPIRRFPQDIRLFLN